MPLNTKQRRVIPMTDVSSPLLQHVSPPATRSMTPGASGAATTPSVASATGRGALTKRLLLYLVLLLQVCFISCLWLLQLGGLQSPSANDAAPTLSASDGGSVVGERVNFIRKAMQVTDASAQQRVWPVRVPLQRKPHASNFRKDFYFKTNRLNKTGLEDEMAMRFELDADTKVWCFREGTANDTATAEHDNEAESNLLLWDGEQCNCRTGWHGRDCGQPEVMWRMLMTARAPFKLRTPSDGTPNQLIYLLEGNFFNLDLLELQLRVVQDVVDYFLIYVRRANIKRKEFKALERRVRETLSAQRFQIVLCSHLRATLAANCSASHAYAHFKQKLPLLLKPTDLLLYSSDRELLSRQALNFLKYYAANVRAIRFRLKHVVYGFYWQHPQQTHLTGLVSSFVHLDDPQLGGGCPEQLLRRVAADNGRPLIAGDLNHYGGWYCEYCQQPDEITAELHADLSSLHRVRFPNATRDRSIDAAYLHKLIASGTYVDGRTQLNRMRRYSDKYYAPQYAEENSWTFGNLLANLYESLDDDIDDELAGLY